MSIESVGGGRGGVDVRSRYFNPTLLGGLLWAGDTVNPLNEHHSTPLDEGWLLRPPPTQFWVLNYGGGGGGAFLAILTLGWWEHFSCRIQYCM